MSTALANQAQDANLRGARDLMYRELLLRAGEAHFAENGFEAARMQDIATAAGVSLKTVYNYFPGKRELYQAIKSARGQELLAEVERVTGKLASHFPEEPLRVILEGMETHLRFFMTHPGYLKINLFEGYAWFDPQARAGQEDLWQRGRVVIEQLFRFGIDAGFFVPQPPAHLLAHLISQQQTRLATWVAEGMREPVDAVIRAAQAEFVRFFCVPRLARRILNDEGAKLRDKLPPWKKLMAKED